MQIPVICTVYIATKTGTCDFISLIKSLNGFSHIQTRLVPGATDNTRYGEGRASPRSFLKHHVANISTAIQAADAQTILNAASARARAPCLIWGQVRCVYSERAVTVPSHRLSRLSC